MGDDDTPTAEAEPSESWVTGDGLRAQRVPGIEDVPDTTYVEPPGPSPRRAILVGGAIGLVVVAIFAAIVLSAQSSGDSPGAVAGSPATKSRSSSTTTTTTGTTTSTSTSTSSSTTTAATAPPTTVATTAPAPPATPRATADPAATPYVAAALPAGVSGTLTSCSWQPTAGGRYEASGTLTNRPSTTHGWTITMHWLQNSREIAQQSAVLGLVAGQSAPWSLTVPAPNPPADPFSCALSAA